MPGRRRWVRRVRWTPCVIFLGCYAAHGDSADNGPADDSEAAATRPDGTDIPPTDDGTTEGCVPDCSDRECGDDGCGGSCPPGCDSGLECDPLGRCRPPETCAGGWLDTTTGFCWQDPPEDDVRGTQAQGITYCANLNRGGYGPGSWHLPSIGELRSLIRGCPNTVTGGLCNVTDTCTDSRCVNPACTGCLGWAGPGSMGQYWPAELGGTGTFFWSSTPYPGDGLSVGFAVHFDQAMIGNTGAEIPKRLRCVRPGP